MGHDTFRKQKNVMSSTFYFLLVFSFYVQVMALVVLCFFLAVFGFWNVFLCYLGAHYRMVFPLLMDNGRNATVYGSRTYILSENLLKSLINAVDAPASELGSQSDR